MDEQLLEILGMTYLPKTIIKIMHVVHPNSLVNCSSVNRANNSTYTNHKVEKIKGTVNKIINDRLDSSNYVLFGRYQYKDHDDNHSKASLLMLTSFMSQLCDANHLFFQLFVAQPTLSPVGFECGRLVLNTWIGFQGL